jgi:hypothetical protein
MICKLYPMCILNIESTFPLSGMRKISDLENQREGGLGCESV